MKTVTKVFQAMLTKESTPVWGQGVGKVGSCGGEELDRACAVAAVMS